MDRRDEQIANLEGTLNSILEWWEDEGVSTEYKAWHMANSARNGIQDLAKSRLQEAREARVIKCLDCGAEDFQMHKEGCPAI